MRRGCAVVVGVVWLGWAAPAVVRGQGGLSGVAAVPSPAAGVPGAGIETGSGGIGAEIEVRNLLEEDPTRRSLFPSWYDSYVRVRDRVQQRVGLETTLSYDVVSQGLASGAGTVGAAAGDLTLSGRWTPYRRDWRSPLSVNFRVRDRRALGGLLPPSQLDDRAGLLWGTVDGFSDQGFRVPDLYFMQTFLKDRLEVQYGQITTSNVFDTHVMDSSKRFFLNQAFSANPAVGFPSSGAGLFGRWRSPGGWDVVGGGSNVQGTLADEDVSWKIDSDALFFGLQAGFDFEAVDGPPARLQAFFWHSDAVPDSGLGAGQGFSLTYEHRTVPADGQFFLRYAYADSEPTRIDHLVTFGVGQEVRGHDFWGLGLGAGRSAQDSSRWQGVVELFYRWQATREFRVSPDLQLTVGEGSDRGEPVQVVAGLRGGIAF